MMEKLRRQTDKTAFGFLMLEDFIYLNMKRQRHIHFMETHALCTVIRNREEE